MSVRDSLSLLQHKQFRIFLLARLISISGSAMAPVALAFSVLGFDSRPDSLAIVLASNTVPQLLLLLVGGVAADRFPRRRLIVLGNLLLAVTQSCVALLVASGSANTLRIALLSAVAGGASAMMQPAMNGVLPQTVDAARLHEANAVLRLPANVIKMVAPAVGGTLVALAGPQWTLAWDAASFALAAALCGLLSISGTVNSSTSVLRDFQEGWNEFTGRFWLWSYVLSGTVVVALWLGGYQLLGPVVIHERKLGAAVWGTVQGAFAVGLVAGGVVSLKWKPSRIMLVCVCADIPLALPLLALAAGAPLPVLAASAVLAGIGLDIAVVCWTTALQQQLPETLLGRVSSLSSLGELAAVPLGYLLVGVAATSLGTSDVLAVGAVVMTLATLVLLLVPGVRSMRRLSARESAAEDGATEGKALAPS
ncbi:MFS transporter [Streptomyces sp. Li-HN-5-11]|uniref:MFS transporter n=1 Tax=Streptomyces sp. Li-HN-5-11 TaxID=3075432 RepID=UPI0028ADA6E8|nr:MFS transporter [Streptomyces sp. Li-HN-5-11]WNM30036.1 MFS transporter [Streptomyces sp. Li-HN-5-11]